MIWFFDWFHFSFSVLRLESIQKGVFGINRPELDLPFAPLGLKLVNRDLFWILSYFNSVFLLSGHVYMIMIVDETICF